MQQVSNIYTQDIYKSILTEVTGWVYNHFYLDYIYLEIPQKSVQVITHFLE